MFYTDFILRIALSLTLGFLIGLERQLTGHPAGIRINVLICMGTSFFTLFPMLYGSDQVFRVGSSIISGVGFLCSGVIFKDRGTVRGMNTAPYGVLQRLEFLQVRECMQWRSPPLLF